MTVLGLLAALAVLAATPASGSAGRYVSMGSSYAAGPGVGERDAASGACGRSLSNYARQLAASRGYALVDVACSGATTEHILAKPLAGFPPQIEAVTADTRLVTVTIGGNDVSYAANLNRYSCRDSGGADCRIVPDAEVEAQFTGLAGSLRRVIGEVRRRAPRAELILVGYLPVLPTTGGGCASAEPMTPQDASTMAKVAERLDAITEAVATETKTPLLRSWDLAAGHDICSAEPWMAGYRPAQSPSWPAPVPYHPNQAGMDHLARALDALLARAPVRP